MGEHQSDLDYRTLIIEEDGLKIFKSGRGYDVYEVTSEGDKHLTFESNLSNLVTFIYKRF